MSNDKENIEQEKVNKQSWWKKLLGLTITYKLAYKLKILWQKIWGKDLPKDMTELFPNDKFEWQDQIDLYNKLKRKLAIKRFFVSTTIVICCYLVLNFIFNNVVFAIKNNSTIACRNKAVCIYAGPKLNYPTYVPATTNFSNGDIFITSNSSNIFLYESMLRWLYDPSTYIPFKQTFLKIIYNFEKKLKLNNYKYNNKIEIYDIKRNRFKKVKNSARNIVRYTYKDMNDDIILYNGIKNNEKFIKNNEKVELLDTDIFNNYRVLTQYKNYLLVTPFLYNNSNEKIKYKMSNKLYLLDLSNLELIPFSNLTRNPKWVPFKKDIIILENGKIIILFRDIITGTYGDFDKKSNRYQLSHIEIYDPELNKFLLYDDFNNYLDENLFYFELENSDVLFINKNSSSIFMNKDNNFINTDKTQQENIKIVVNEINQELNTNMGLNLEEPIYEINEYIKLDKDKLLITCGRYSNRTNEICNQNIFFDYKNMFWNKEANFIYKHQYSSIHRINSNKYMFIGGTLFKYKKDISENMPNKRVQILELNY